MEYSICHRYRKEIPELLYRSVWWRRQPWSYINWGYLSFCRPHTRKQTQTKCVHDFRAQFNVSRVLVMFRPQYIGLRTWRIVVIVIVEKTRILPIGALMYCRVQVKKCPGCVFNSMETRCTCHQLYLIKVMVFIPWHRISLYGGGGLSHTDSHFLHIGIKMAQVLGSPVYTCIWNRVYTYLCFHHLGHVRIPSGFCIA